MAGTRPRAQDTAVDVAAPRSATNGARPDDDWLTLTEGLDPYERFRYIARHVLSAALDEALAYVIDERIFEACEDDACIEEHLRVLEDRLASDGTLLPFERAFLCAAVAAALRDRALEPACPWDGFVRLAGGPVPASGLDPALRAWAGEAGPDLHEE